MNNTDAVLNLISRILLSSFFVALAWFILWVVFFFVLGDFWFVSHTKMYNLTEHELSIINYAAMGFFKLLVFCFILCPFIAIETMIRFRVRK